MVIKKNTFHTTASSELVGTLILSALIVLVIGIVGVSLLSQGPPAEVPALRVDIHNESGNLILIHRGGDTLFREKTRIFVDGVDQTSNFILEGESWGEYGAGDWLILPVDLMPYRDDISVQIVHTGPEVPALLFTIGDIGVPPGPWGDTYQLTLTASPAGAGTLTGAGDYEAGTSVSVSASANPGWTFSNWTRNGVLVSTSPGFTYTMPAESVTLVANFEMDPTVKYTLTLVADPLVGGTVNGSGLYEAGEEIPVSAQASAGYQFINWTQNGVEIANTSAFTFTMPAGDVTLVANFEQQPCNPGLRGFYYPQQVFSGIPVIRIDPRLRFADAQAVSQYGEPTDEVNWPDATLAKQNDFSIIYEGYLVVDTADTYTFSLRSDDGSRLWINEIDDADTPVVDNWGFHAPTTVTGTKYLETGYHPVRVKMFENTGAASLQLRWESPNMTDRVIESFCTDPVGYQVDFAATPLNGDTPLLVNFTDLSTGLSGNRSWSWTFGDGGTSTAQNPTHIYTSPGNYTVSLFASGDEGSGVETKTGYITVTSSGIGFTAESWVRWNRNPTPDANDQRWATIVVDGNSDGNSRYHLQHNRNNQNFEIAIRTADNVRTFRQSTTTPLEGIWYYVVGVYNQETGHLRIYVNGVEENSVSVNRSGLIPSPGLYQIGGPAGIEWPDPTSMERKFDGNILCLGTHERAFTPQEILDNYNAGCPPVVDFTSDVTNGTAPLAVQFTDLTSHSPTAWAWDFGDGGTSTLQNPTHTYVTAGTYTVSLTVTKKDVNNLDANVTGTKIDYITVEGESFVDFVINENVFVYGNVLNFQGGNINGPGATVVINGGLVTSDLNQGATVAVSTIYIDGNVNLNSGSAGLGSLTQPGNIYVNGDMRLWTGQRDIYGDIYVNGNFDLKDAHIHDNVYVNGNLKLGNTPTLSPDTRIYYTGTIAHPGNYPGDILAKCIHQATVPGFDMPDQEIPPAKPADWYSDRGYVSDGALTSNMKVFADSYSPTSWQPTATNVIIIARTGDITITGIGESGVTGVFFAPNGRVTFNGAFLEGVVIARDGFYVTSGGTQVTFKNLDQYIGDPNDYPF